MIILAICFLKLAPHLLCPPHLRLAGYSAGTSMKRYVVFSGVAASLTAIGLSGMLPAEGQVIPDATLPVNSVVSGTNPIQINGGTVSGSNLFHSFLQFSVGTGNTVLFNNVSTIQNIIARVTGGTPSQIDGLIRANGTANLFLLNPNGIFFGPNAQLNVGGSFVATTATSFLFADGTAFGAPATATPLLTMTVPTGVQFGANPGAITVQGTTLQVQPNQTLALIGGNVNMTNGSLLANGTTALPGGRIEVGSVGANQLVRFNQINNRLGLDYSGVQNFQDMQLQQSQFSTSGAGGGAIQFQGRQIIASGSSILSETRGAIPGEPITLNATDTLNLNSGNSVLAVAFTGSTGATGDLTINTSKLLIQGSEVRTSTRGAGRSGTLTANANQISIQNSQVAATTFSSGQGGTLILRANDWIDIAGSFILPSGSVLTGGVFAQSSAAATGAAGSLLVSAPRLTVSDRAEVSVTARGRGAAGNLTVNASEIFLNQGVIRAETRAGQGNITLNTRDLRLRNGSLISTNSTGPATGGNISINTRTLVALENSDITANAQESFGGRVSIRADGIFGTQFRNQLTTESDITATSALGPLFSGSVTIQTPDIDPSQGLVQLQTEVVDPTGLIAQGCATGQQVAAGEFVITGRGGLPPNPGEALTDSTVLVDLGKPLPSSQSSKTSYDNFSLTQGTGPSDRLPGSHTPPHSQALPLVQAQGWMVNSAGKVVLVAQAPNAVPHAPWLTPASCTSQTTTSNTQY